MNTPKRIQRKRTKGTRLPKGSVYVGRPTIFGNPFIGPGAVDAYERWLKTGWMVVCGEIEGNRVRLRDNYKRASQEEVLSKVQSLRGKDLACWCPIGKRCHADVLIQLANQ